MTEREARDLCARLAAEHPDTTAETRADERPSTPDDPRSGPTRLIPPYGPASG